MQAQKINGRLLYMGLFNLPWKLVTDDGEIDLWPVINKFLTSLNGKRADHKQEQDGYILAADEKSEFRFKYIRNRYALLMKPNGFGVLDTRIYLDATMTWLSGRRVEIEIEYGKQLKITADKSEDVFSIYVVGDGNSCEVPRGAEKTVCKSGQRDRCLFLYVSSGRFYCEKFSPNARVLLNCFARSAQRISRIGNCAFVGRKE